MNINEKTRKALLRFQQNEITESLLYTQLAAIEKDPSNKEVLLQIANDEKGHYTILKKYTGQEISPNKLRVTKYYWLARILGITFAIKLMEDSEESAKNDYASYDEYPDLQQIARDEDEHEQRLIALINEERLEYMGSGSGYDPAQIVEDNKAKQPVEKVLMLPHETAYEGSKTSSNG